MNLVLLNMSNQSDWEQGIVNRNYFVVEALKKRPEFEKILQIDFLAQQPYKQLFGKRRACKYLLQARGLRKLDEQQFVYEKLNLFTSKQRMVKQIEKLMFKLEMQPEETVIWSYNAFFPEVFAIKAKKKIFDAVDNWSHHASYQKEAVELQENYKQIDNSADCIFTVSQGLTDLFSHAFWVPNGIDLAKFETTKPVDLNSHKPVIGYVGTIQERLDFDLIEKLLQDHQDKQFVFIGPVWKGVQDRVDSIVKNYSNIEFLGRKSYNEVPSYLAAMNVTIIPHKIDDFINSTNPMKMYEYLAAGKPVVTTPGAGTEMFAEYLEIHEDASAFSQAIFQVLQEDSVELAEKRKNAVASHGWGERVNTMMETLLK